MCNGLGLAVQIDMGEEVDSLSVQSGNLPTKLADEATLVLAVVAVRPVTDKAEIKVEFVVGPSQVLQGHLDSSRLCLQPLSLGMKLIKE